MVCADGGVDAKVNEIGAPDDDDDGIALAPEGGPGAGGGGRRELMTCSCAGP